MCGWRECCDGPEVRGKKKGSVMRGGGRMDRGRGREGGHKIEKRDRVHSPKEYNFLAFYTS